MESYDAMDSLLHDLLFEIQQLLKAVENQKQLIAVHTKDIEEAKQCSKHDLLAAVQLEENIKLFEKQQLHCSKNIDSVRETMNVVKDQEQVLTSKLECLRVERGKKEDDHQKVIAHYNAEIKRRQELYKADPSAVRILQAEAAVSDSERCLKQLESEFEDLKRQKNDELRRKDEICSLQAYTNENDFCIKFAEMYVAHMKRDLEIARRKDECEMLQKQIDEVKDRKNQELEQRAQQDARKHAAMARAQAWADQQKRAEHESRTKQRDVSVELMEAQQPRQPATLSRIERCLNSLSLSSEQRTLNSGAPLLAKPHRSPPKIMFPTSAMYKSIPARRIVCEQNNQPVKFEERPELLLQRNSPTSSSSTHCSFSTIRSLTSYPRPLVPAAFHTLTTKVTPQSHVNSDSGSTPPNSTSTSAALPLASKPVVSTETIKLPLTNISNTGVDFVCSGVSDHLPNTLSPTKTLSTYTVQAIQDTSSATLRETAAHQSPVSMVSYEVSTDEQVSLTIAKSPARYETSDAVDDVEPSSEDEPTDAKYELTTANQESDLTWIAEVVCCKTPQRPLVSCADTPESSYVQASIGNERSENFDWGQKLAQLKDLATSPGIMLYTGRRMFTNNGGLHLNKPASLQLNDESAMETEKPQESAIDSNKKDHVATTSGVLADSMKPGLSDEIRPFQFNIGNKSFANTPASESDDVLENLFNFDMFCKEQSKKVAGASDGNNCFSFGDGDKSCFKGLALSENDECAMDDNGFPKDFGFSLNETAANESPQSSFSFSFGASASPGVESAPFKFF